MTTRGLSVLLRFLIFGFIGVVIFAVGTPLAALAGVFCWFLAVTPDKPDGVPPAPD